MPLSIVINTSIALVGGEAPEEPALEIDGVEQVLIAGHRAQTRKAVSVRTSAALLTEPAYSAKRSRHRL